jgi:hypothetical protein
MRKETIAMAGLAILLLASATNADRSPAGNEARPEWAGKERREIRQHRLLGNGRWKAHGRRHRARQRWTLDVDRDDSGRIHGSVKVEDSVLFASGRIEGVIKGRRLTGTVFDEGGAPVARINGVITPDGVSGSYNDRSGGTGEWVWDGALPE